MIEVFAPFPIADIDELADELYDTEDKDDAIYLIQEMEAIFSDADFESVLDKRCPNTLFWLMDKLRESAGCRVQTRNYVKQLWVELAQWKSYH